jgi:DNA-binding transcriptional ArsR family regulator
MTMDRDDSLSATFAALADPTRRAILATLATGEATVSELSLPFAISGPAISRHLRVLTDAGLIERKTSARWRICSLRPDAMRDAHDWLGSYRRYWEENLDRLAELVEEPANSPSKKSARSTKSNQGRSK